MKDTVTRTILQNEYATLVYHVQHKIVHHTLHKPVSGPPFREVLIRGVELFERLGAKAWLSDDRGNGALHPDDGKWTIEAWSPRAITAGWKHWAIVMPEAALGKANIRRFIREYADRGVEVKTFETPDGALEWLRDPSMALAI